MIFARNELIKCWSKRCFLNTLAANWPLVWMREFCRKLLCCYQHSVHTHTSGPLLRKAISIDFRLIFDFRLICASDTTFSLRKNYEMRLFSQFFWHLDHRINIFSVQFVKSRMFLTASGKACLQICHLTFVNNDSLRIVLNTLKNTNSI